MTARTKSPSRKAPEPEYSYQPGTSAEMDAWFTSFIIENHLDYFTNPQHAASDEHRPPTETSVN